ncbi:MAG TPA: methyltransferase domain-containing protein [Acidimicrobiales bacterium]|nr:methyltransferase domain-containing protein [Acidimicrobiales bacterium]
MAVYDEIGRTYARTRRADPRIAAQIAAALGDAASVLNVGAGSGNYEPTDRRVIALEPSMTMIRQRPAHAASVVQGAAGYLPFVDKSFDVAMGTLTLHHWLDLGAGLTEVRRVSRRQVFMLFDGLARDGYWLIDDYFPAVWELESERQAPTVAIVGEHLDVHQAEVVMIPSDCTDGFGCAYWNRPEAHLDPIVLAGMSWSSQLAPEMLAEGIEHLRDDLETGRWDERYGHLRSMTEADYGYKLVICGV